MTKLILSLSNFENACKNESIKFWLWLQNLDKEPGLFQYVNLLEHGRRCIVLRMQHMCRTIANNNHYNHFASLTENLMTQKWGAAKYS